MSEKTKQQIMKEIKKVTFTEEDIEDLSDVFNEYMEETEETGLADLYNDDMAKFPTWAIKEELKRVGVPVPKYLDIRINNGDEDYPYIEFWVCKQKEDK